VVGLGLGLGLGGSSGRTQRPVKRMAKYLFVDGGFVDAMVAKTARKFGITPGQLDYRQMTGGFQRTFYYDALPTKKPSETEEIYQAKLQAKLKLFEDVNRTPFMHTREGITRNRLARLTLEQKGVDILLAIDVFKHASLATIQEAHIMTTDLDFFPLFEALRDTPVSVHLHCCREETSSELMALADVVQAVTHFDILHWLRSPDRETFVKWNQDAALLTGAQLIKNGTCEGQPFLIFERPDLQEIKYLGQAMCYNPQNLMQSGDWEFIVSDFENPH
jgi:uncharacterized LabA/DUF88 family protein